MRWLSVLLRAVFEFVVAVVRFMRDAFCEAGQPSFTRIACGALVYAYIRVMFNKMLIPTNSEMFAAVILALYGSNALKAGLSSMRTSQAAQAVTAAQGAALNAPVVNMENDKAAALVAALNRRD